MHDVALLVGEFSGTWGNLRGPPIAPYAMM